MSVYRRTYTVKGVTRTSRYYTIQFTAPDGQLVRRSTKCTNKRAAEAQELELRNGSESGHVGVVDASESRRPIAEQIEEFIDYLRNELHRDSEYCRIATSRLKLMVKETGWRQIRDITLASFEDWRREQSTKKRNGRPPKPKTLNQFLDILKRFCDWGKKRQKIKHNPIADAEHARVIDNPYFRRAATVDELQKLLNAASDYRRKFYQFAIYTPLRRRTLTRLVWGDLHLDDERPWLTIRPETIKSRKADRSPLRTEIAAMMKGWRDTLKPKDTDKVFPIVPKPSDIAGDLERAGIPFSDNQGNRRLDLHAFRKTAIKLMKDQGVPIEQAAAILHHKDIRTTKKYYDEGVDPVSLNAVEQMPLVVIETKGQVNHG